MSAECKRAQCNIRTITWNQYARPIVGCDQGFLLQLYMVVIITLCVVLSSCQQRVALTHSECVWVIVLILSPRGFIWSFFLCQSNFLDINNVVTRLR